MEIGFVAAFFGGALALLSPCSALLLPAFFTATVGARMRLLVHGAVFYVGLAATLVPIGLGLGALGTLLADQRGAVIAFTSIVLVVLGVLQVLGFGFDLSRAVPGMSSVQQKAHAASGLFRTLLLGAAGGIAGFCAGPTLGAVLTIALAQGSAAIAGVLLAVYAAGMVVPLIIIAALWNRLGDRGRRVLRGRTFRVFGREFHTVSVITGLLIIAVGVLFWTTNGLVSVPSLVPASVLASLQTSGAVLANPIVDVLAIIAVAALALVAWWAAQRRRTPRA
ncbi:cytochrome c biogenesis CcdA family protein [Microbacterium amylolyticum]|uniref:Cytochrome c biogenesis protein CcdA n=1 Tax=Microbacterium amylolyticum TaxID=936337 RepID=A0ABS4ZJ91_9MICO|nr:cytochrome c biogenesis protein CcdA [Microbacterium amylolyticum]MBP2437344.1 cytochrome c biogenesis protein CcdA [Microbacterium amylolyticum]